MRFVRQNAIAFIALFVALGGTGLAASGWRITSLSQIKPSVRAQLRGPQGEPSQAYTLPTGLTVQTIGPKGAEGRAGQPGQRGEVGLPGKEGTERFRAYACNALSEVALDLERADQELRAQIPHPVGPTGLINRQESELQGKETTLAAFAQFRAQSNC